MKGQCPRLYKPYLEFELPAPPSLFVGVGTSFYTDMIPSFYEKHFARPIANAGRNVVATEKLYDAATGQCASPRARG